ncbi:MAG: pyridoxamine 5'-phosphate oxidase family protein [Panacibacter sp.]
MFGTLENNEIEALLYEQLIGRIGCNADDVTYVVPISYAYDGDCVYAHTYEGMKIQMMRKKPKVCFQVDDMHDMANWKSVIAWGEFEELQNEKERTYALEKLINRSIPFISSETTYLSPYWPFRSKDINEIDGIVFRIQLTKKTGRFEKSVAQLFFGG